MQLDAYLHFNGNCEQALDFYAAALGGRIENLNRFEGSPMEKEVGDAAKQRIMHATLVAGDLKLMASDGLAEHEHHAGTDSNVSLSLGTSDRAEAERVSRHFPRAEKSPCRWSRRSGAAASGC